MARNRVLASKREVWVLGQLEHALVEREPGELAIGEAVVGEGEQLGRLIHGLTDGGRHVGQNGGVPWQDLDRLDLAHPDILPSNARAGDPMAER